MLECFAGMTVTGQNNKKQQHTYQVSQGVLESIPATYLFIYFPYQVNLIWSCNWDANTRLQNHPLTGYVFMIFQFLPVQRSFNRPNELR